MNDADMQFRWAWSLVDALAAAGVARVVASPGARSTPLALAALRHPGLMTRMIVDERSAAFFALGLARAEGRPVALIATSGSAVANWLPAVVEADMARLPLLLLSADRPPELQDCGANQTMAQDGLFGRHVRACHLLPPPEADAGWLAGLAARAVAASLGPLAGPVHINVPLREPLVPGEAAPPAAARPTRHFAARRRHDADVIDALAPLLAGPGAIVCGPEPLGEAACRSIGKLARRLAVPVFADLLSGLRFGPGSEAVLAHPEQVARAAPPPAWLLRLGGAPVTRAMGEWLGRGGGGPQITQVVVAEHPRLADPQGTCSHWVEADVAAFCDALAGQAAPAGWLESCGVLDRAAAAQAEAACAAEAPFEGNLLRRLFAALPAATPLFLGNSLAVRAAEWFCGRGERPLRLSGNRGLSGIDGNLSTAFGVAAALGPTVAVVGDLAFLHDLNALCLGGEAPLAVLLLDNGGGGIFDHLPQAGLPEFETGWLTPRPLAPDAACRAFGLPCHRAAGVGEAVDAVLAALAAGRSQVVHVPIDRRFSLDRIRAFHSTAMQGA